MLSTFINNTKYCCCWYLTGYSLKSYCHKATGSREVALGARLRPGMCRAPRALCFNAIFSSPVETCQKLINGDEERQAWGIGTWHDVGKVCHTLSPLCRPGYTSQCCSIIDTPGVISIWYSIVIHYMSWNNELLLLLKWTCVCSIILMPE